MRRKNWRRTWLQMMWTAVLAVSLAFSPASVPAASISDADNNTAGKNELHEAGSIDRDRTGSLTIHKYDITAAEAAGEYTQGKYKATGKEDTRVETALADYAVKGVQFTLLKVGDAEQYVRNSPAGSSEICLVYEIPENLRSILKLESGQAVDMAAAGVTEPCTKNDVWHYTSTQISEALQEILAEDEIGAKNMLENYLYSYETQDSDRDDTEKQAAVSMPETDEQGVTTVGGLPLGLYLIAETKVPEQVTSTVNPWFISLPFTSTAADPDDGQWLYDMVCYPKNQTGNPTLDKSVRNADSGAGYGDDSPYRDTATASGGDLLDYLLVSRLPHITSAATYISEYTFTDQLSKGITYTGDVRIALYETEEEAEINLTARAEEVWDLADEEAGGRFARAEITDADGQGQRMVIRMTEEGLKRINGGGYSDHYMVVYYTATVNADATVVLGDEGNVNDVSLLWSRTNNTCVNSLQDRNYVYAYGIDLTKSFSDDKGDASRVQFKLYNTTDAHYVTAAKTADGQYYVAGKTVDEKAATGFVPAVDGKLYISGLEADTYQLSEVATDNGYTLLQDPVEIAVRATDREVIASVAGTTGLDKDTARYIVENYGTGIRNENGQLVTEGESELPGDPKVAGPREETANGRTIGSTDLYIGDIHPASATVDHAAAKMENGTALMGIPSENAAVVLRIVNNKGFLLPQTGGNGLYLITILGVLTAGFGCYLMSRKSEKGSGEKNQE